MGKLKVILALSCVLMILNVTFSSPISKQSGWKPKKAREQKKVMDDTTQTSVTETKSEEPVTSTTVKTTMVTELKETEVTPKVALDSKLDTVSEEIKSTTPENLKASENDGISVQQTSNETSTTDVPFQVKLDVNKVDESTTTQKPEPSKQESTLISSDATVSSPSTPVTEPTSVATDSTVKSSVEPVIESTSPTPVTEPASVVSDSSVKVSSIPVTESTTVVSNSTSVVTETTTSTTKNQPTTPKNEEDSDDEITFAKLAHLIRTDVVEPKLDEKDVKITIQDAIETVNLESSHKIVERDVDFNVNTEKNPTIDLLDLFGSITSTESAQAVDSTTSSVNVTSSETSQSVSTTLSTESVVTTTLSVSETTQSTTDSVKSLENTTLKPENEFSLPTTSEPSTEMPRLTTTGKVFIVQAEKVPDDTFVTSTEFSAPRSISKESSGINSFIENLAAGVVNLLTGRTPDKVVVSETVSVTKVVKNRKPVEVKDIAIVKPEQLVSSTTEQNEYTPTTSQATSTTNEFIQVPKDVTVNQETPLSTTTIKPVEVKTTPISVESTDAMKSTEIPILATTETPSETTTFETDNTEMEMSTTDDFLTTEKPQKTFLTEKDLVDVIENVKKNLKREIPDAKLTEISIISGESTIPITLSNMETTTLESDTTEMETTTEYLNSSTDDDDDDDDIDDHTEDERFEIDNFEEDSDSDETDSENKNVTVKDIQAKIKTSTTEATPTSTNAVVSKEEEQRRGEIIHAHQNLKTVGTPMVIEETETPVDNVSEYVLVTKQVVKIPFNKRVRVLQRDETTKWVTETTLANLNVDSTTPVTSTTEATPTSTNAVVSKEVESTTPETVMQELLSSKEIEVSTTEKVEEEPEIVTEKKAEVVLELTIPNDVTEDDQSLVEKFGNKIQFYITMPCVLKEKFRPTSTDLSHSKFAIDLNTHKKKHSIIINISYIINIFIFDDDDDDAT
uniref:CSON002038 protein n=1 Tax=Culicoides sonorensis TaxID=179676 RepID=A0A336K6E2_CULSO